MTYGTTTRSILNLDKKIPDIVAGGRCGRGGSVASSIGKVSKYLKEKYVPLYNLMFVIKGHPHRVHPYIS